MKSIHKAILPLLTISGQILLVPAAVATVYDSPLTVFSTKEEKNQRIPGKGDSIIIQNYELPINGIGYAALVAEKDFADLGDGKFDVDFSATITDANVKYISIYGLDIANAKTLNLGVGSTINVRLYDTDNNVSVVGIDHYIHDGTNPHISASQLTVNAYSDSSSTVYGISSKVASANHSATDGSRIDLGDSSSVNVTSSKAGAIGIIVSGNSTLNAEGLSVNVNGVANDIVAMTAYVRGLSLSDNVAVNLGRGSEVNIQSMRDSTMDNGSSDSFTSVGISLGNASTLKADALKITAINGMGLHLDKGAGADLGVNSQISTTGIKGYGVYAANASAKLEASGLTISTEGKNASGLYNNGASTIDLGTNSKITTTGESAAGIKQIVNNNMASVYDYTTLSADKLTVNTQGNQANALIMSTGKVNLRNSTLISQNAGTILLKNEQSDAKVVAEIIDSQLISGGNYIASAQSAGSTLSIQGGQGRLDKAFNDQLPAYGLWATDGGTITATDFTLNTGDGIIGVSATNGGNITLTGTSVINSLSSNLFGTQTDNIAISAIGNNSVISGSGIMAINGALTAQDSASLDLTLMSSSVLKGAANQLKSGTINLAMDSSNWIFDQNSDVNQLALSNNSKVIFNTAGDGRLTMNDLSGNGLFMMRTDIVGDGSTNSGDKIIVTGTSSGAHQLNVLNRGDATTTGNEILTVVETADGNATFTLHNKVELGGYLYQVRQNGTDWELYSSGLDLPPPEPEPEQPEQPPVTPPVLPPEPEGEGQLTTSADAGANFFNIGYLMNYAETQTLLQRMGDLRQNNAGDNIWLRGFAGKFDSFSGGKLSHFDMNYSGVQLGADKRVSSELPLFAGLFIGQTHGKPNYRSGDGTTKSDSAGLYATYMANNGFYLDGVAKYSHIKNSFNVRDSQNSRVNGNGTSNGFSASLESGQKFSLNQSGDGWYIEPQAQLSYSHQGSSNIVASNGLKVSLGSYESIIGRASAVTGYEWQQGDNSLNVYLKTGYLREFSGDSDYRLNGSPESHSFKGNWWNNGVGVSAQMNKQHTLYLDLDTSTGDKFNQRQINAGYRLSF
ncbi:P.93 [Pragia fontium]|uniref:autotransporter outer membrane beta-barrel domain-containing protein n=1 Tax=Pragia fontium TaxID=82985 RepID=UPI000E015BF4|nr:autotransporter outer membrane beta-barrel domain-containing protein [Pragia fontium]SUB82710.1 P.93 [Pragia fontium]